MPLSLTEAATALRDGALTSVELTTVALRRADALDPRLGVYLSRLDSRAMAAARRADADFDAGRDRGLLQGIPIGLKDIPAAGADSPCADSPVLDPAWGTACDAPVVARIRRGGAVITGKVAATDASGEARPRNPWDPATWPCGSSSGTGAGVATGMFLASVGTATTDTGGSVRDPAAFCGISGLMPTLGRVPLGSGGHHVGSLARTARDCAAVLGVIAGRRPGHAVGGDPHGEDYVGALCGSLEGMRIGVNRIDNPCGAETGLWNFLDDAADVLADLGADVVDVTWLPAGDASRLFADIDAVIGPTTVPPATDDRGSLLWPVLVLPMGFGSGGLPLALQIAGSPFEEATVLRIGDAYQQITDWHRQVPALSPAPAAGA